MGKSSSPLLSRLVLVVLAAAALSCGGDRRAEPAAARGRAPGQVPNACRVIAAAELAAAFGEVGRGRPSRDGKRRICAYENDVVVGVSRGDQYAASVALARRAAICDEVPGVGERATFCDTAGFSGQLLWVDRGLTYAVTAPRTDRETFVGIARRRR